MCFFPRIFIILPSLPRKHWAAIVQKLATVHSHCVRSFTNLLQRYIGDGWVAVNYKKNTIFPN